ncbi:MAG: hypothetical protein AB7O32_17920, partial [Vicinamibacterales bacterium]
MTEPRRSRRAARQEQAMMGNDPSRDPGRYQSHVDAARRDEGLFEGLYVDPDPRGRTVAQLRRRRRRAANDIESVTKSVSLVEEDGTLYWRDGIPTRPAFRRRARRGLDA